MTDKAETYPRVSTVYGPVNSWRLGRSLGVDLLFVNSICSFRCVYCQLGKINQHTSRRRVFVPTDQVIKDLAISDWRNAEVITFSGSGEPTLAANLGDVIQKIEKATGKPTVVLTNAAHLDDEAVVADLKLADRVFCKLDAVDEAGFQRINRPVDGVTLASVVRGIKNFRRVYDGFLAIQIMYQPFSNKQVKDLAEMISQIDPDEVQVNTVSRAIPREWFIEARGNYDSTPYPSVTPRAVADKDVLALAGELEGMTAISTVTRCSVG